MPTPSVWLSIATYCRHMAPHATDLFSQIGHMANAVENARGDLTALPVTATVPVAGIPGFAPEDVTPPTPKPRKRRPTKRTPATT